MSLTAEEKSLLRGRQCAWRPGQSLAQWLPVALGDNHDSVWWRFIGRQPLAAPFFTDTLWQQPIHERLVCETPLSALDQPGEFVPPTCFVFHVSRCGSTLLTQMLAALPEFIIISEPPVLDSFFRAYRTRAETPAAAVFFRKLVAALGQRRSGLEQHLVIKLDSWHTPWMRWLGRLFPSTPMVFLYRQPAEVLESHRRERGRQMVPGLCDIGPLQPQPDKTAMIDLDDYARRVLEGILGSALEQITREDPDLRLELVNYTQLPAHLWTDLLPRWSINLSGGQLERLQERARFHSKHGVWEFRGDPPPGSAKSTDSASSVNGGLDRLYARVEAIRLQSEARVPPRESENLAARVT